MVRILMLNPPFLQKFSRASRSPAVSKGGTLYYPLWLACATGVLEKEGHEVKLVDAPAEGISAKRVLEITREFKPELVVLDTSTASIQNDVRVLEELKKELPDCFAVLVGTHVSALPEESLKMSKSINAVARKEYDFILRDLAKELELAKKNNKKNKKLNLKQVKGLSYRNGGSIVHNDEMPFIENLDEIPFVSKVYEKHLNIKNYFYAANLWPEITIVTGRGCPFKCKFCVLPQVMNGRNYRKRSVQNVLEELEYVKQEFPEVKEVFIEDDTLTADGKRVQELCDKIVEKKLNITWSCNARADVDLQTLQKMKKAGCRLLCVGFESGSQTILNNICKGTNVERIRQFMKDCKKVGILVHGCFILGNQGETKETLQETIKFAKELDPDTAQFFPIMVYPGTESFEYFKEKGFLTTLDYSKWLDSEGSHNTIVSRPELSNKELVEWCDEARRQFYLRSKYFGKKALQVLTQPKELKRILKSGKIFYKFITKK